MKSEVSVGTAGDPEESLLTVEIARFKGQTAVFENLNATLGELDEFNLLTESAKLDLLPYLKDYIRL